LVLILYEYVFLWDGVSLLLCFNYLLTYLVRSRIKFYVFILLLLPQLSTAPAPSGGLFGSAPAPSGGLFGSTPAPTSAGGLFGSTTPAPAGGLFGSAPAPSGGLFGSTTPAPAFGAQPQQQQYVAPLSGLTPYSQLPPNLKNAIDDIYRQMMSHRRTLATVKTMAPSLLEDSTQTEQASQPTGADAAAGSPSKRSKNSNFAQQLTELHRDIEQIAKDYQENINKSNALKSSAGEVVAMAKLHGLWPIETIATRRQVILSSLRQRVEGASASASNDQSNLTSMPEMDVLALQHIMDMRAASVDRKEQIPSPYYWEVLRDLEKRANTVSSTMEGISHRLIHAEEAERNGSSSVECNPSMILCDNTTSFPAKCAKLARIQNDQFLSIAHGASRIHEEVEILKARHRRLVEQRGTYYDDPFFKADVEEMRKEREIQQRIIEERLLANKDTAPVAPGPVAAAPAGGGGLFGNVPAPASGGLFGSAPAPSGGLFGSSTTATAPSTGGLFGTPAAAPTPSGGGLFGSTPGEFAAILRGCNQYLLCVKFTYCCS
jgi:hypothetical protein